MKNVGFLSFVLSILCSFFKPLMNQRGQIGDPGTGGEAGGGNGEGDPTPAPNPLEGTPFKSIEELAKGWQNANAKIGELGNELGAHKATVQSLTEALKGAAAKPPEPAKPAGPDYSAEKSAIQEQIDNLDPMSDGYQKTLSGLVGKLTKLTAQEQHEKTLAAAGNIFKKELEERDLKTTQQQFLKENPTFNTPEMQARIKEYIAKDKFGMSDPLVAFREIQRDEIAAERERLAQENAEMKKILELQKGKESTGKVVTKGAAPAVPATPTKVAGKDLDNGMREILARMRA